MDLGLTANSTDQGASNLSSVNLVQQAIMLCTVEGCPPYNETVGNSSTLWGTEIVPIGRRPSMHGNRLMDMSKHLLLYCLPPVLLLGSIGNILCMVVLRRKAMQTTPSSTYLICLAATDTLLLYASAFKTWIRLVTGFELIHSSDAVCRLQKYTFFTCTHLSAWLVVLLSVERFMVVTFPFKAPSLTLVRRPRLVSTLLALTVMAVNGNLLWATQLKDVNGQPKCLTYGEKLWVCEVLPLFNLLVYAVVPLIIILATNSTIIVLVLRQSFRCTHEARSHATTTTSPTDQSCYTTPQSLSTSGPGPSMVTTTTLSNKTQRRLTCTLLIICISWLVLSMPYSVLDNVAIGLGKNPLVRALVYIFLYLNHALNFYIYCLTGKKFRLELKRTFGCRTHQLASGHKHHFQRTQQQKQELLKNKQLQDKNEKQVAKNKLLDHKDCQRAHLYN